MTMAGACSCMPASILKRRSIPSSTSISSGSGSRSCPDARNYGRLIVHGHTPTDDGEPDLRINRLNIDTGAVYGGPLTAAVFDEDETMPVGVIQVDE